MAAYAKSGTQERASTGISGLDNVLRGGLPRHRLYMVEGNPGAGKTTLALQFLLAGVRHGESVLYVTLSETAEELYEVAESHGWSLAGIQLLELNALAERLQDEDYTVYHPADVELGETTARIRAQIERTKPSRVVLDSVSELKILSQTIPRYRREILGMKQFFAGKQCTVLVLDDRSAQDPEQQLQSIAHGVIKLERETREYGSTRRQIQVVKMRAVRFWEGLHDFAIRSGGIEVYPRLFAYDSAPASSEKYGDNSPAENNTIVSGIKELDTLLGAGLDRASSTLLLGPAGSGKTTISAQYVIAALERGEAAACFLFEESRWGFLQRAKGLGMNFQPHLESGLFELIQLDPADLSPGEFAKRVCDSVEIHDARMIVIDSLNGYINAMPSERHLLILMHELLMYLGQKGVVTILIMAQHGMLGSSMATPIDVSFLADTVILLRYFEAMGEVRQAISVVKKRRSGHERTIREMRLGSGGIVIGNPLKEFEGVLTGVPRYNGKTDPLLRVSDEK